MSNNNMGKLNVEMICPLTSTLYWFLTNLAVLVVQQVLLELAEIEMDLEQDLSLLHLVTLPID